MNTTRLHGRFLMLGLAVAMIALLPHMLCADPAEPVSTARLMHAAAESGQFDQVLQSLRADNLASNDAQAARLTQDVERYLENTRRHDSAKRGAHAKAMTSLAENVAAGKLDNALVNAVEAHAVAADPKAMLESQEIRSLVEKAEFAASQSEHSGDWIEALNLYRLLEMLFDPSPRFKPSVERVVQRIRVLRLYAPAELTKLYEARAKRLGADAPKDPPPVVAQDDWRERLAGINRRMMRDAFREMAGKHTSAPGYGPLMKGALTSLLITIDTQSLAETFKGLGNQEEVARFRDYLRQIQQNLDQRRTPMTEFDANTAVDRILAMNRRTVDLPDEVILCELTEGAVRTLDEFSAMIWPYEVPQFQRNTDGNFSGVGIQIALTNGQLTVVSPLPETPAYRAGIRSADIITRVNGHDTANWTLDWAVHEITGPEGTAVTLTIKRAGVANPFDVELIRRRVKIESIQGWKRRDDNPKEWDFYIDRASRIGYVRMSQFIPQTPDDLDAAINQLQAREGLDALVLDLRFNPGGLLNKCVEIANKFVSHGTIVSIVDASGITTRRFNAQAHRSHPPMPIVVLINQGSASASEIVAGALQDHGKAIVVGTRSFGKGSVQDLYPLDTNSAYLKLTTQHYMLPLGRKIHRLPGAEQWGVEPDLVVPMMDQHVADGLELRRQADVLYEVGEQLPPDKRRVDADEILQKGLDLQLEAALLILKTRLLTDKVNLARKEQGAAMP